MLLESKDVQALDAKVAQQSAAMKTCLPLTLVLCWLGLVGCLSNELDEEQGGIIDAPCESANDCLATAAECVNYAGAKRCLAECTASSDCGPHAQCVNEECWRSCSSVEDCEGADWDCRPLKTGATTTSAGSFCVPPCSLYACSASGFTYSCGTASYSSSTHITYGAQGSTTTDVAYTNGHTVHCAGTAAEGKCNDDSGATCSW